MNIQVYNTLSRRKELFKPLMSNRVGIYLCGPTVYDKSHIGHMVGPVVFDTIKRFLKYCGFEVTWVVNITDVDDKLIRKSKERGISMEQVAQENMDDYLDNLEALGVDQIDYMPTATGAMSDIMEFIHSLIVKGFAYVSDGDVFFDVSKAAEYGKLSNRTVDDIHGDGGDAAAKKRSTADFALWKSAKSDEPSWMSPWGRGRPGWHVECSAMSRSRLGETFDIHGGGLDLAFPHHENEIAQSECCHGKPMARYWMHHGLLRESHQEGKISRSQGAGGLADLIAKYGGETLRFFLLRTHYRSTAVFSEQGLRESQTSLESFYQLFYRYEQVTGDSFYGIHPFRHRGPDVDKIFDSVVIDQVHQSKCLFLRHMDDDFNTAGAISDLFAIVRVINNCMTIIDESDESQIDDLRHAMEILRELTAILGLFLLEHEPTPTAEPAEMVMKLVDAFVRLRTNARTNKDFTTADAIRNELSNLGITLEDRAEGTAWRMV